MPHDGTNEPIHSVSRAISQAKSVIQSELPKIWVTGEISAVPYLQNHWYFSIKDESAELKCACFSNQNQRIRFRPEIGIQINARGTFDLYLARGEFQFIVEHMEIAGEGELRAQYERLKRNLEQEGLFHERHKQLLPAYPKRIAVVTSKVGAAIGDVLKQLRRRYQLAEVVVIHSLMQGRDAPASIVSAMQRAMHPHVGADVILITRGGGSFEDLNAFNDEGVARAIFACHLPTVCAIGHERDTTIAELVADHRAATPTAAVVAMTQDQATLATGVRQHSRRIYDQVHNGITARLQYLSTLNARLRQPSENIAVLRSNVENEQAKLSRAIDQRLTRYQERQTSISTRLQRSSPASPITLLQQRHHALDTRLQLANPATKLKELRDRFITAKRSLVESQKSHIAEHTRNYQDAIGRLKRQNPSAEIQDHKRRATRLQASLAQQMRTNLGVLESSLRTQISTLNAVSPLATLERGYAVVTKPDGTAWGDIVSDPAQVANGETIHAHVHGGTIGAVVQSTSKRESAEDSQSGQ